MRAQQCIASCFIDVSKDIDKEADQEKTVKSFGKELGREGDDWRRRKEQKSTGTVCETKGLRQKH